LIAGNLTADDEHRPIAKTTTNSTAPIFAPQTPRQTATQAAVTLDGIANLNFKCALLTIHTPGCKKQSVILKEGESIESVRVVHINMTNAVVVISNCGRTQTMALSHSRVYSINEPTDEPGHEPVVFLWGGEDGER